MTVKHIQFLLVSLLATSFSAAALADSSTDKNIQPVGIHLDQSQNVLFEQFGANTFSLQVLQNKDKFNNHDLILGGALQTDLQHWNGGNRINTVSNGVYESGNDLYFTQATFDIMGNFTPWLTGFFSVADGHVAQAPPDGNDIFLNRSFLVLGNVNQFPLFLTAGINTLPFGVFAGSGVWDTPLTGAYFNPSQAPQLSLAFFKNGWNASATIYSDEVNHVNHNVFSIYYNKTINKFSYSLGAGYLTRLATNTTGTPLRARTNRRQASGFNMGNIKDFNGSIGYGPVSLSGEYDCGSDKVNGNTDVPQAASVTVTYTTPIAGKDTTFGVSRSRSFDFKNVPVALVGADAVPLASSGIRDALALSVSRPIFRNNFSLGANFEENRTYDNKNTYAGTIEFYAYL